MNNEYNYHENLASNPQLYIHAIIGNLLLARAEHNETMPVKQLQYAQELIQTKGYTKEVAEEITTLLF